MIDVFSRFTETEFLFEIQSIQIVKPIVKNLINKHGIPCKILSDQGRQFISTKFKKFISIYKIQHITSASYNPTGNAITERINI